MTTVKPVGLLAPQRVELRQTQLPELAPRQARRRRVLMVAPTSFFADYGCHVRILEEARALQRLGQQVTIGTYHNGRNVADLDIRRTMAIPWRERYEVGSSRHKLGFDLLLSALVWRVGWRLKPDIIHGHLHEGALIGAPLAAALRRPLVFDFQGSLSSEMVDHGFLRSDGWLYRPVRRLERLIDHLPRAVITSSFHAADFLAAEFDVPAERLHRLPDCVNADVFRPDVLEPHERQSMRRGLGVPADRDVVVYLGLLAPYQGTDMLLQSMRRLLDVRPRSHLLLMGYPGVERYQATASALGVADHVTFTGRVAYEQAPYHLALGDVAVAPKVSATEGSGKLLNYMAMGLPVVAFDTPVSREYLRDDGVYAPIGDVERLAGSLAGLMDRPDIGRCIGQRLRQRAAERYSWDRAGRALLDVYSSLEGMPA
jgi:glycosyltransferase involved in cell wall biosynthesis